MDELMSTDACTLQTAERPLRLAEFDALFRVNVRRVERDNDLVRLHLSGHHGLLDTVRDLAEREAACCSFFTFVIEGTDDDLVLTISVPADRRDILAGLADRASELAR